MCTSLPLVALHALTGYVRQVLLCGASNQSQLQTGGLFQKIFSGQNERPEQSHCTCLYLWFCRFGVVTAYVISGCLDLYLRSPYTTLATFLLFSGSYIYISIRARHSSHFPPWLPGYYIVFTTVLIMASIALMVVVIFPRKGVASIASWLPLVRSSTFQNRPY